MDDVALHVTASLAICVRVIDGVKTPLMARALRLRIDRCATCRSPGFTFSIQTARSVKLSQIWYGLLGHTEQLWLPCVDPHSFQYILASHLYAGPSREIRRQGLLHIVKASDILREALYLVVTHTNSCSMSE